MPNNLYQRDGIWYARIQVRGKDRRKSLQTGNRREAEARLKAYLAKQSPYHGTVRKRFEDVTAEYLDDAETTLKPKTHKRYQTSILKLAEVFAGRWWDAITKDAIIDYIAERKRDGIKIPTIKRDLTALSQAAEYAIERGWSGTNPVTQIPKRPLRYKTPVFKRPSARSVKFALDNAYGNIQPLARFLLATGMRLEEATTLERGQIDKRRRVATLTETKNGHARAVSLSDEALAILKAQPAYMESELVFPAIDRSTGEARPYKQASTNWGEGQRKCVKKAAETKWSFERFRLHDLRHIYAIDYLAHGGNIYLLQQQLGHSSIRQTEEYLQYLSPEEQVRAKLTPAQKPDHPRRFTVADGGING
jgi:integrase/recombinase XerD